MANALSAYMNPEGGLREDVQTYADDQMLPYLNQRPSLAEQSAEYWLPQFAALLGPGPRETLDKGWTPPTSEKVFADPLMNMLQPGNLGMAGMLVGKGSKLWKSAPQAYHGTTEPITSLGSFGGVAKGRASLLDTLIGTHVAESPEISNVFAEGNYGRSGSGRVIQGQPTGRYKEIEQKMTPGGLEGDQFAIGGDISGSVLARRQDLFREWFEKRFNETPEKADEIYSLLKSGGKWKQYPDSKHSPTYTSISHLVTDNDSGLMMFSNEKRTEVAKDYVNHLKDQGYSGVKYQNTSPSEAPEAANRTNYIMFHPEKDFRAPWEEQVPQGAFSNLYDKKPMLEVSDAGMNLMISDLPKRPKLQPGKVNRIYAEDKGGYTEYGGRLGELVDHEELYNAYPKDIENIPIKIQIGPDAPSGGDYNPLWGIRVGAESEKAVKRHLVHEIEHAIQEREGWARGGSPELYRQSQMQLAVNKKNLADEMDFAADMIDRVGGKPTESQLNGMFGDKLLVAWDDAKGTWKTPKELKAESKRLRDELVDLDMTGNESYKRNFGEYMARDSASRNALTEAQRMSTMPFSSEPGMTPDKMIYRYGDTNALRKGD